MTVIGFNFKKINVEKQDTFKGKININNNIALKGVEEHSLGLTSSGQKSLKFDFEFVVKYVDDTQEVASMLMLGTVIGIFPEKEANEAIDEWKKHKRVTSEVMLPVMNSALTKCNIQSLILSDIVSLPPPVQLPKVEIKKPEEVISKKPKK